ncbi:MAG: protein kinase [Gemmatimonadales bacterium]
MGPQFERLVAAFSSRYEIERELGAGGMATVYLAYDPKHDRKVAVKVLRPELAVVLGAERFLNEIKVTANLQHPHILPLFDSGEADSFLYYVMPYVEGESLRDKLDREKQLPVEEAVRLASEVASALDYAHRHDVVHRDIKPANIMIHDGSALVADFGIALALRAAGGDRLTETGLSLGTPHYMSPEQATGDRDVDARTDVYSLGAVLYETLAGEPPHTGGTIQAVISKVVTEDPKPLGDHRHSVPAHLAMAIEQSLAKIPADRFASAADFMKALGDPGFTLAHARSSIATAPVKTVTSRERWRTWVAAVALVLLGVMIGRFTAPHERIDRMVARFGIPLDESRGLTGAPVNTLALSPDGRTFVYVGRDRDGGSGVKLYARTIEELEPRDLPGTRSAANPVFSPDGSRVAFLGPGGLFHTRLSGGAPTSIPGVQSQALSNFIWLDNETLVASTAAGGLQRIRLDGSSELIATPDAAAGESALWVSAILPDQKTLLVVAITSVGVSGPIVAVDAETGRRTPITNNPANSVWYSDGYLLWALADGVLFGARFDLRSLAIESEPVNLAEAVRLTVGGQAQVAVSANGAMVYVPNQPFRLMLVDRSGRREVIAEGRRFHSPRFSPDGRHLAVDFIQQGARDVWSIDLDQRTFTRLTFEGDGHDPVWYPDGRSIAFASHSGIFRRAVDGSGVTDSIFVGGVFTSLIDFTPDGSMAITAPTGTGTGFDLALIDMGEDRHEELYLTTPFNETDAALSPDGRWLAYVSDETGRDEVYVRGFPEGGGKIIVSVDGGSEPVWSPDGGELYYLGQQDGQPYLVAATVSTPEGFRVIARTPLFEYSEFEPSSPHANYDISPDGTRFVVVHLGSLSEIIYVQNWTEEVRRRSGGE